MVTNLKRAVINDKSKNFKKNLTINNLYRLNCEFFLVIVLLMF